MRWLCVGAAAALASADALASAFTHQSHSPQRRGLRQRPAHDAQSAAYDDADAPPRDDSACRSRAPARRKRRWARYPAAGESERAVEYLNLELDAGRTPPLYDWNGVVFACCKEGAGRAGAERALGLLRYMQDGGEHAPPPERSTYSPVVAALLRHGDWEAARGLLDRHLEARDLPPPDMVTWTKVMAACPPAEALAMFREIQKVAAPDAVSYNAIVKVLLSGGDLAGALDVYRQMRADAVPPDVVTFNTLMNGCRTHADWATSTRLFTEMDHAGVSPDQYVFGLAIGAFCELGDWKAALDLHRDMARRGVPRNQFTYTTVIDACAKAGELELALAALAEMEAEDQLTPGVRAFTAAVSACRPTGEWQRAKVLLERMQALKVAPNVLTYTAALSTCIGSGQLAWAIEIRGEMRSAGVEENRHTYNCLVSSAAAPLDTARRLPHDNSPCPPPHRLATHHPPAPRLRRGGSH